MVAERKPEVPAPDRRLARGLAAIIAIGMIGLGVWSVVSQHYFGSTSKFGGAEVSLDGQRAVLMGLVYIALGCMPLALWFRTAAAAAWWGSLCAVVFLGLLAAVLYG